MKKLLLTSLSLAVFSTYASAYDDTKAANLEHFYAHMTQKACADSTLFMKAGDVMKMLRKNKVFTLLDVRTDGESNVVALSGDNAMHISIDKLFKKENLDKLPTDKPIVIVCHSGTRATLAAIGLKRIGFKKVHVLKGGIIALAKADNTKNAPIK